MENAVEVSELKKYYDDVKAVDGVTFTVETESIFGMLGPNGVGKTTTIETIIGLLEGTAGEIYVLGMETSEKISDVKKRIGVQLQDPSLFPRLTVGETLDLFAAFYPEPLSVKEAAEHVGLSSSLDGRINSLSGGQRHRLAVSLALISNGDIIFLDEPTTGLDPKARRDLWETIRNVRRNGSTVFMTTHYMDEAEKLCDELVIIDHGKIIATGSPDRLIEDNFPHQAVEFADPGLSPEDRNDLLGISASGGINFEENEGKVILYSEDVGKTVTDLIDYTRKLGIDLDNLKVRSATLDDVFLKLTGRAIENE